MENKFNTILQAKIDEEEKRKRQEEEKIEEEKAAVQEEIEIEQMTRQIVPQASDSGGGFGRFLLTISIILLEVLAAIGLFSLIYTPTREIIFTFIRNALGI